MPCFREVVRAPALIGLVLMQILPAQSRDNFAPHSAGLQAVVDRAVQQTIEKFAARKLATNHLAVSVVDLRNPRQPLQAGFREHEQIYPASVIKLFYLVAAHRWMEDGKIQDTDELRRAMRDMIVDSYNEPTGYIVDLLTGTTSGPELSPAEMEQWYHQRNAVNRYFTSLGYTNINANRKPWCEGPYGREQQSVKMHAPNHRNWLTTDATARLLTEVVMGRAVSAERSRQMMELLQRDPHAPNASPDGQARGYTGMAVPLGSKLWSKAGWTSQTRHDAAYVELPNGAKFVLVTFTTDHAREKEIIATIARVVVDGFSTAK